MKGFTVVIALLLAAPVALTAQDKQARTQKVNAKAAAAGTTAPAIDPEAVAAVQKMEAYLKTLSAYSLHADTTTDEVLLAGPKVQFGGTLDGTVKLPNRLRLTVARDDQATQEFFYDGTTLAVWIPDRNMWASAPVAPTVGPMVSEVRRKYDLSFPLDDLIRGANAGELLQGVTAGIVIGDATVAGAECIHLGFHKEGLDAQIWIEKGDHPLPRKMVLTTLTEPSQPQHTEVLTWNLQPRTDDALFVFTPPAGAEKIVFAEPARTAGKKEGSR